MALLVGSGGPYGVPVIKSRSATCKASAYLWYYCSGLPSERWNKPTKVRITLGLQPLLLVLSMEEKNHEPRNVGVFVNSRNWNTP